MNVDVDYVISIQTRGMAYLSVFVLPWPLTNLGPFSIKGIPKQEP